MTGGSVAYATTTDVVFVPGRVSITGTKVAPSSGAGKWTVSLTSNAFSIVFTEQYSEFLGAHVTPENSAVGATTSGAPQSISWTASSRTLVIKFADLDGTPTAIDLAFSFLAIFSDNKAP